MDFISGCTDLQMDPFFNKILDLYDWIRILPFGIKTGSTNITQRPDFLRLMAARPDDKNKNLLK